MTKLKPFVKLDTTLTPELIYEGYLNDIKRKVMIMRKEAGLKPHEKITIEATFDFNDLWRIANNQYEQIRINTTNN